MIQYVVRFPKGFRDLSIIPKFIEWGGVEVIEGDDKLKQIQQSQPEIEVLERRLPKAKKTIPARKPKDAK